MGSYEDKGIIGVFGDRLNLSLKDQASMLPCFSTLFRSFGDRLHLSLKDQFSIEVLCHNPPLLCLPDHTLPVLNHDQTDHNTKPMEHWCIVTVA